MTPKILALRVSRRAIAAAVPADDAVTLQDGRHISSRRHRARIAAERYVRKLLDLTHPTLVVVDAPAKEGTASTELRELLRTVLAEANVPLQIVTMPEVLVSYGVPGVRTRVELRKIIEGFGGPPHTVSEGLRPYVADAAAVALYADVRERLGQGTSP